jgi:hypothetical protein
VAGSNGQGQSHPAHGPTPRRKGKNQLHGPKPALERKASAELRDHLLAQLSELVSGDDAALWAHRSMRAKNGLAAADAQRVEEAFQDKLASFAMHDEDALPQRRPDSTQSPSKVPRRDDMEIRPRSNPIDKSLLALPEPRRVRDRDHVKSVAKRPCLICGRTPSDAHHLRYMQSRALERKVSDEFTVPLCRPAWP